MLSTDISEETKNKWDKHRRVDLKYNILTREKDFFFWGGGIKKKGMLDILSSLSRCPVT